MSNEQRLVDKREALKLVNKHIKFGLIDFETLIELMIWHNKLTLWILQESGCSNRKKVKSLKDEIKYLQNGLNNLKGKQHATD